MKKRELVHLHALLSRTRRFLRRRERIPEDTFEGYEAVGVAPQAVYESKGVHEEAVVELATALVDAIEDAGEAEPGGETPGSEDAADEQPLGATND
jgi:hypothetical protein